MTSNKELHKYRPQKTYDIYALRRELDPTRHHNPRRILLMC